MLFPSFLNPKYTRIYGKAFEHINTMVGITVPDGVCAFGIGTLVKNGNDLINPFNLLIDNIKITIEKLK